MEALSAGYLVRYTTFDDLVRELRQADQLGTPRNKLSHPRYSTGDTCPAGAVDRTSGRNRRAPAAGGSTES